MIAGRIHGWTWHTFIRSVLGLAIGLLITQLSPGAVADPMRWMVMGAAAIAICAMILPGISGSFLLLIMGMYAVTIDALHARDVIYIALF
jgi:putative membrane protein